MKKLFLGIMFISAGTILYGAASSGKEMSAGDIAESLGLILDVPELKNNSDSVIQRIMRRIANAKFLADEGNVEGVKALINEINELPGAKLSFSGKTPSGERFNQRLDMMLLHARSGRSPFYSVEESQVQPSFLKAEASRDDVLAGLHRLRTPLLHSRELNPYLSYVTVIGDLVVRDNRRLAQELARSLPEDLRFEGRALKDILLQVFEVKEVPQSAPISKSITASVDPQAVARRLDEIVRYLQDPSNLSLSPIVDFIETARDFASNGDVEMAHQVIQENVLTRDWALSSVKNPESGGRQQQLNVMLSLAFQGIDPIYNKSE